MKHSEIPTRNEAIVAALKRGVSVESIAVEFSLSTSTIGKMATAAGLTPLPRQHHGLYGPRNAEIVRRASGGEDFTSISKSFEVTRERIRQIVERDLGKSGADLLGERRSVRLESKQQQALTVAAQRPEATCAQIAEGSGLRINQVEDLLGIAEAARRRPARLLREATSTDDMLAGLRHVAALPGGQPLTGPFYDAHRPAGAVSSTRITQVFDTWSSGCLAAGVVPQAAVRTDYTRRWDRTVCLGFVADYLTSCAERPSFARFRTWIRAQDDAPSAETVRLRCGKWIDMVRDDYAIIEADAPHEISA